MEKWRGFGHPCLSRGFWFAQIRLVMKLLRMLELEELTLWSCINEACLSLAVDRRSVSEQEKYFHSHLTGQCLGISVSFGDT